MLLEFAPISKIVSYDEAWLYAITLTHNNHKDWRLPTQHEYNYSPDIPNRSWYEDPNPWMWHTPKQVTPVRTL